MARALAHFVLFTVIAGSVVADTELTVVTYNIRHIDFDEGELHWEERRAGVLEILTDAEADLVGLQEAGEEQRNDLEDLGMYCIGCSSDFTNHNAILFDESRLELLDSGVFWLSDTPEIPDSTSWGNKTPRTVTWGHFEIRLRNAENPRFVVYNTHLDHRSPDSRLPSVELILDHAAGHFDGIPLILLGDFNARPDWREVRFLTESEDSYPHLPLNDVFVSAGSRRNGATFRGFEEGSEGLRIDYVFASREFRPRRAVTIRGYGGGEVPPSDHLPIRAVLTLDGPEDD
ncbi:MAG: endonuclease/exonuclease/phosphatase family protein [Alkalispirochaeta sp.]